MKSWEESWTVGKRIQDTREVGWVSERQDIIEALFGLSPLDLELGQPEKQKKREK